MAACLNIFQTCLNETNPERAAISLLNSNQMKKVSFISLNRGDCFRFEKGEGMCIRDVDRDGVHGYAYKDQKGVLGYVSAKERRTLKVFKVV